MLTIGQERRGGALTLSLEGRLDAAFAPQLEALLSEAMPELDALTLDLAGLMYISSAGLRVLLMAQKAMAGRGRMAVRGANDTIMEVFRVTGFDGVLPLE